METLQHPLAGAAVLVTRPAARAADLCQLIRAAGGIAVACPVLAITPLPVAAAPIADVVIFSSQHAVECGLPALAQTCAQARQILAVGQTTAALWRARGIQNVLAPEHASSEGLLQLPQLQAHKLTGVRVLLVSGQGGRPLLAKTLRARGAVVSRVAVYRRGVNAVNIAQALAEANVRAATAAVVTSVESLQALAELACAQNRADVFALPLAVMSARVGQHAAPLGFIAATAVAAASSDDGLLQALIQLHTC